MPIFKRKIAFLLLATSVVALAGLAHAHAASPENPCLDYGLNKTISETLVNTVPYPVLTYYHQKQPELVDPTGDFVLYEMSQKIPQHVVWMTERSGKIQIANDEIKNAATCATWFFGNDFVEGMTPTPSFTGFNVDPSDTEEVNSLPVSDDQKALIENELKSGELGVEDHKRPLNNDGMQRMFARVIQQELKNSGIEPRVGEFHKWSPEFLKNDIKETHGLHWVNRFTKLLIALSKGETGRFMTTGTEISLRDWIMSQPLDSITMPELFRASYRLSKGDVYQSLLGIENVLARDWTVNHRENLPVTMRLTRITHEFGSKESRFGDWYHFFGITLYGYTKNEIAGVTVGEIEVIGSIIMNHFPGQHQKHSLNRNGGLIGYHLKKMIEKKKWSDLVLSDESLESSSYLNPSSDLSEKIIKRSEKIEEKEMRATDVE